MTSNRPGGNKAGGHAGNGNTEGILGGLTGLLGMLGELADKGMELRKAVGADGQGGPASFRTPDGREGRFHVGFNVRTAAGASGSQEVSVEPFGDVDGFVRGVAGQGAAASETREPPVDVFDEETHVLVVVEMPGIADDQATFVVEGDRLVIEAQRGEGASARHFAKTVELPQAFDPAAMTVESNNGVFEVRLNRPSNSSSDAA